MSDALWASVVFLALGGVFFWGWFLAQLFFRFPILLSASLSVVRKYLENPSTSSGILGENTKQAKGNSKEAKYASYIEKCLDCFQKVYSRGKGVLIWVSFRQNRGHYNTVNHDGGNTNTRSDDKPKNVVGQLVDCKLKESPQHSNANVSQAKESCQPKVNDTILGGSHLCVRK